jgi:uncharacterized membrane protein
MPIPMEGSHIKNDLLAILAFTHSIMCLFIHSINYSINILDAAGVLGAVKGLETERKDIISAHREITTSLD